MAVSVPLTHGFTPRLGSGANDSGIHRWDWPPGARPMVADLRRCVGDNFLQPIVSSAMTRA
jgi:hypothetical protein